MMETDIIFMPEQKTADPARSAVFLCVYEREKHTSIIKIKDTSLLRTSQRSSCNTRQKTR